MSTAAGEVFKELHALTRNLDKLTDGQAKIELPDEDGGETDDLVSFSLTVSPNAGHYKGAAFNFKISVPESYPNDPPSVECLHSVYHPNIDIRDGESPASICVNLLSDDWGPEVGLDGCVIAVLFLFHHPNQDDALSHVFSGCSMNEEEFAANVRTSLKGEEVEGYHFDKLIADENDIDKKDSEENSDAAHNPVSDTENGNPTENTQEGSTMQTETLINVETSTTAKTDLGLDLAEDTNSSVQENTNTTSNVSHETSKSEPKLLHSDDTPAHSSECEDSNGVNKVNPHSTDETVTLDDIRVVLPVENEVQPRTFHFYIRKTATMCLQLFKILNPYQRLDIT